MRLVIAVACALCASAAWVRQQAPARGHGHNVVQEPHIPSYWKGFFEPVQLDQPEDKSPAERSSWWTRVKRSIGVSSSAPAAAAPAPAPASAWSYSFSTGAASTWARARAWTHGAFASWRLAWHLLLTAAGTGVGSALFLFDVLGVVALWHVGVGAVGGQPLSRILLRRTAAVLVKLYSNLLSSQAAGGGKRPRRDVAARLLLAAVVVSPMAVAATLFVLLPLLLFSMAIRQGIPLAIGIAVATAARFTLHFPFSLFLNTTALKAVLSSYRAVAAVAIALALADAAAKAHTLAQAGLKAYRGEDIPVPAPLTAPIAAVEPPLPPDAFGVPVVGTSSGTGLVGFMDRVLAGANVLAARTEEAVDGRLKQQAPQAPAQQDPGGGTVTGDLPPAPALAAGIVPGPQPIPVQQGAPQPSSASKSTSVQEAGVQTEASPRPLCAAAVPKSRAASRSRAGSAEPATQQLEGTQPTQMSSSAASGSSDRDSDYKGSKNAASGGRQPQQQQDQEDKDQEQDMSSGTDDEQYGTAAQSHLHSRQRKAGHTSSKTKGKPIPSLQGHHHTAGGGRHISARTRAHQQRGAARGRGLVHGAPFEAEE